jgi:hypothetical protein
MDGAGFFVRIAKQGKKLIHPVEVECGYVIA